MSGLCLGNWQVEVTDAAGCSTTTPFIITTPAPLVPNLVVTPETCAGACSGAATVAPTGGTGTITVQWTPAPGGGQGTNNATGLCAGTNYMVTLSDGNGCDSTFVFTVPVFTPLQANASSTPASCSATCDGTATVGPTGGQQPYTYDWNPPATGQGTPQVTGLCAGPITVTITDVTGCSITQDILITEPSPIADNAIVTEITCAAACDGAIALAPTGGTAPYTIVWSPAPPSGQGTTSITGLCAGTWTATITDAHGCSATFSYDLVEPAPLAMNITVTQSQCQVCVGGADLVVSGGTPNYTIVWTAPGGAVIAQDVLSIANLCGGVYSVLVTDAHGCFLQQAIPITDSNGEVLTPNDGSTSCPNTCDGIVSVAYNCSDPACAVAWFDAL
ncbi:MAG TPA: SprB repeat-containing protein, partial [Flavobacteriales bacterium]|nr:SprB repeat-containing protein [Flavobacteriales bacterium]